VIRNDDDNDNNNNNNNNNQWTELLFGGCANACYTESRYGLWVLLRRCRKILKLKKEFFLFLNFKNENYEKCNNNLLENSNTWNHKALYLLRSIATKQKIVVYVYLRSHRMWHICVYRLPIIVTNVVVLSVCFSIVQEYSPQSSISQFLIVSRQIPDISLAVSYFSSSYVMRKSRLENLY
jgi:hypothetical protein